MKEERWVVSEKCKRKKKNKTHYNLQHTHQITKRKPEAFIPLTEKDQGLFQKNRNKQQNELICNTPIRSKTQNPTISAQNPLDSTAYFPKKPWISHKTPIRKKKQSIWSKNLDHINRLDDTSSEHPSSSAIDEGLDSGPDARGFGLLLISHFPEIQSDREQRKREGGRRQRGRKRVWEGKTKVIQLK